MNTLCNETLRLVVNAVTDGSIPTLRGCSKEFKSLTSDRYISVQSKQIEEMYRELQKNVSNGTDAMLVTSEIQSIVKKNIEQPVVLLSDMLSVIDMCQYVWDVIDDEQPISPESRASHESRFPDYPPLEDFKWDVNNYPNALRYFDDHKYDHADVHIPPLFEEHCNW